MQLTYLSHSCFYLETGEHRLIIDPFLSANPRAKARPEDIDCDYILLTHGHDDHLGDAIAIARRTGATIISTFEVAMYCGRQGVKVHPMQQGGAWNFPFGRVKLTIAHHGSAHITEDEIVYLGNPAGILITTGGKTLYHAGDTALFLDMKLIGELDRIDVALLPIGDNFTMGPEDAARAVEFLNARLAIPMHYGTFDLIDVDPQRFVERVGADARVMAIGETIEI